MRDQRDARSPTGIAAASASPARRFARSSARGRVPSGDDTSSVFILYAIPVGLAAGFAIGGRLANLGTARFRLAPVAIVALAIQVGLFSELADGFAPEVVRGTYVLSTALVIAVVLANVGLAGVPLIVAGAVSNVAAIVTNGGAMPASPLALAALGFGAGGHTSSIVVEHPNLEPLTDVFAMPAWLPLANVFSVGDVLIGIGVAVAIAGAMGRPGPGSTTDRTAGSTTV